MPRAKRRFSLAARMARSPDVAAPATPLSATAIPA